MDYITSYMDNRRFPRPLRKRVRRYFKRFFQFKTSLDEQSILNDLEVRARDEQIAPVS